MAMRNEAMSWRGCLGNKDCGARYARKREKISIGRSEGTKRAGSVVVEDGYNEGENREGQDEQNGRQERMHKTLKAE